MRQLGRAKPRLLDQLVSTNKINKKATNFKLLIITLSLFLHLQPLSQQQMLSCGSVFYRESMVLAHFAKYVSTSKMMEMAQSVLRAVPP